MFTWINTKGLNFEEHVEGDTNYLTDYDISGVRLTEDKYDREGEEAEGQRSGRRGEKARPKQRMPFPLNKHFISHPILSEELREEIWRRVTAEKKSVRIVSVELGVEMRRVGAVVRLMEIEKQWRAEVSNIPSIPPSLDFS